MIVTALRTVATHADTAVELGNDRPLPTQRLTLAIRLADGGAEQVPDAVGESQAERSAGDEPQDSSADAASAQAGCSTSCLAQLRRDAAVPDDDSRRAGQSREPRTRAASRPRGGCAGVPAGRRRAEPSEVDDRVKPARAVASPNASAAPTSLRRSPRRSASARGRRPPRSRREACRRWPGRVRHRGWSAGGVVAAGMACCRGHVVVGLGQGRVRSAVHEAGGAARERLHRGHSIFSASVTGSPVSSRAPTAAAISGVAPAPARASGERRASTVSCAA